MPTGDQKEAKLFYAIGDGEWNEISYIQSFDSFKSCDDEGNDDFEQFSLEPNGCSFEFDIKSYCLHIAILRAAMPNNWLKMHGIPMRRGIKERHMKRSEV